VSNRSNRSVVTLVIAYAVTLIACQQPEQASAEASGAVPDTEDDSVMYALGMILGNSLRQFSLSEEELKWVQAGLAAQALGREAAVNPDDYGPQLQKLQRERTQGAAIELSEATKAFLEAEGAKEGAKVFESGLIMQEITPGDGPSPSPTDTVEVHYHGTLQDGTVFDSSVDRGTPARFPLNRVIPCWTEGVAKMKVGGKSRLICPPGIAYGARGSGKIPPNAPIVFEVELLSIE